MIEDILLQVHRPAQYLGNEWNVSKKQLQSSAISFALGFPDLYEVGMSNLGLRIIYGLLNSIPDVACERFFCPEPDFESFLRKERRLLSSLESRKELREFDLLGFSIGSELNYTNILSLLDLAGLPFRSAERDKDYPLLIAGGPCAFNPEPLHEFFDLFFIGEAEEAVVDFVNLYRRHKAAFKGSRLSKDELLVEFSRIEGVYVPALYEAVYGPGAQLLEFKPKNKILPAKIRKRIVRDLNTAYFPVHWVIPHNQVVHDRASIELMRGCPNRCRFCQARSQYFPPRTRDSEQVKDLALAVYKNTGYEELSLAGLSVSDYPQLDKLIAQLSELFKDTATAVSLPSLKVKSMLGNVANLISKTKKTGLTFAPEAGTERMRRALAKDFCESEFFQALEEAYKSGYQHLKLYFLIGLPNEGTQDLDGILDFCNRASEARKKVCGLRAQVNVSVNCLIPKPHTPLQWSAMESMQSLKEKTDYLKKNNKNSKLRLSFHDPKMGYLEGILSRGDRRLAKVLLRAYGKGARFDAWSDYFSLDRWLEAFREEGIDPDSYLQGRDLACLLPWDFIDTGISKEHLLEEFNKSIAI